MDSHYYLLKRKLLMLQKGQLENSTEAIYHVSSHYCVDANHSIVNRCRCISGETAELLVNKWQYCSCQLSGFWKDNMFSMAWLFSWLTGWGQHLWLNSYLNYGAWQSLSMWWDISGNWVAGTVYQDVANMDCHQQVEKTAWGYSLCQVLSCFHAYISLYMPAH